jgi:hypothetical protein
MQQLPQPSTAPHNSETFGPGQQRLAAVFIRPDNHQNTLYSTAMRGLKQTPSAQTQRRETRESW